MIDARQLHSWLGRKREFAKWISERIAEYGFEEGTDFSSIVTKTGGRPRTDYLLTVDMAKELSMVERTERGKQTRRYFIEMEKTAHVMAVEMTRAGLEVPDAFFDAKAEFAGVASRAEERLTALEARAPQLVRALGVGTSLGSPQGPAHAAHGNQRTSP